MQIHARKLGFFGAFCPQNGELYTSMNETPKGTSLGGNTSYDVDRQNRSTCAGSAWAEE